MTDESQAPAGRETDAKVARAMGYQVGMLDGEMMLVPSSPPKFVSAYSADTPYGYAAMREMLTWMNGRGIEVTLEQCNGDLESWSASHSGSIAYWLAPSLPLAVCRLVLAVAQSKVKP